MEAKEQAIKELKEMMIDYNGFHCSLNDLTVGIGRVLEEYANTKAIKWIPIDKSNLPNGEVLAKSSNGHYLLGGMHENEYEDIMCSSESEILGGVTHYIDINKIEL